MRRSSRSAIALCVQREYQTILRSKQRARKQTQVTLLASQARSSPKAFWSKNKSWAGQVDLFLSAIGMPCDLSSPQTVSVSAVVEKLKSNYLASVNACSGVKMQQYLGLRSNVDTASYSPAAYLQVVVRWKQRKHLAQLRTGSHWLAVETGRFGAARVERQIRLCQRCEGSSVDDVEHMVFDCSSLEAERQKHQSLFARRRVD